MSGSRDYIVTAWDWPEMEAVVAEDSEVYEEDN